MYPQSAKAYSICVSVTEPVTAKVKAPKSGVSDEIDTRVKNLCIGKN